MGRLTPVLLAAALLAIPSESSPQDIDAKYGGAGGLVISYSHWNGNPAPMSEVIVCDERYNPLPDALRQSSVGRGIVNTARYSKFIFLVWSDVPGFGRLKFYADNGGRFYTEADRRIDLNAELVKSRLANVRARMVNSRLPRNAFSPESIARMEDAETLLAAAEAAKRETHRLALLGEAFAETLWAGETVVLDEARARIRSTPRRLAFRFGANSFRYGQGFPNYEDRFREVFNFATVPFYLGAYEPDEGQPRHERNQAMVAWLLASGIEPKGHPLVWLFAATQPDWLPEDASYETVARQSRERVIREVTHWRDRIRVWDVINEAHDWANCYGFTDAQQIDLTRQVCAAAREADPGAVRVVNLCCLDGAYAASTPSASGEEEARPLMTPHDYASRLIAQKVDFEVIGLQYYFPGMDLFEIARQLDRYAALGKPLHLTEVAAPSDFGADDWAHANAPDAVTSLGSWHRSWDPDLQAEWLEGIYTLAYAHPAVHAVTWWDFADYNVHFFPHGGLLDRDGEPKPAYERLKALLDRWGVGVNRDDWAPGAAWQGE